MAFVNSSLSTTICRCRSRSCSAFSRASSVAGVASGRAIGASSGPDATPATELARLKAEHERLRQRQIVVLREELTKAMERVEALRRELRLLGDHEVATFWGKTNWHQIFERLPPTFTAKDMAALTGAP